MLFFAHTHLTVTVTVGLLLIPKVFESAVSFLLPRLRKINVVMQKQFCVNLAATDRKGGCKIWIFYLESCIVFILKSIHFQSFFLTAFKIPGV